MRRETNGSLLGADGGLVAPGAGCFPLFLVAALWEGQTGSLPDGPLRNTGRVRKV